MLTTSALWIFVAVAVGIMAILLAAVVLGSLFLAIFFAILLVLLVLAIWQRQRVMVFANRFWTHPNTVSTFKRLGNGVTRLFPAAFQLLERLLAIIIRVLAWVVILPYLLLRSAISSLHKRGRSRSPYDESKLDRWKKSESRDVKRPRDPRTKYCLDNIGNEILIKYWGTKHSITPLRVFTKPEFRKTYVEAEENREIKTFDIDDITIER